MSDFTSPLELEYVDGRIWRVTSEFVYHVGAKESTEVIRVPAGMLTDFASVPRLLWNILPPTGGYGKAAVIHDRLYQTTGLSMFPLAKHYSRAQADSVLLEAMLVLGVGWWTRKAIYAGVRLGGRKAWNQDRVVALLLLAKAASVG